MEPGEQKTKFQLANRAFVSGDYETAIRLFSEHAGDNEQDRAQCHFRIGKCYSQSNVITSPVEVARGVTLVSRGDLKNAEKHYRLALEQDPHYEPALYELAILLGDKSEEKYELLQTAAEGSPGYLCLLEFGDLLRSVRKDYDRAYEIFRRAIEEFPRYQTAYQKIQYICRKQGRAEEAREWSQKWKDFNASRKQRG